MKAKGKNTDSDAVSLLSHESFFFLPVNDGRERSTGNTASADQSQRLSERERKGERDWDAAHYPCVCSLRQELENLTACRGLIR